VVDLPDLISELMPAVVHVDVLASDGPGNGSGFAIRASDRDEGKGIIVTNAHVVADASDVSVRLYDERQFDATVRISDASTDLALLEIDEPPLAVLKSRALTDVRVGEQVIAIGSPYGMVGTVTIGIVSGLDRTMPGLNGIPLDNMIQTDALVNPGNSGGPLIGTDGRVIGVNDQIRFNEWGGSSGLGFALPIGMAETIYDEICETGASSIRRATIGARIQLRSFTEPERQQWGQKGGAIVLDAPHEGMSAELAGIQRGDVITIFDGEVVQRPGDLYRLLDRSRIDKSCSLEFLRDGERHETTIVPVERTS
jgi:S1-C subfamily serine protease